MCKATLVESHVRCLLPDAPALSERDQRRRRIILCQSVPESDVVLKGCMMMEGPPENLATADYRAVIADVEALAPEVARFRLQLNRPAVYRPGQYAILTLAMNCDGLTPWPICREPGRWSLLLAGIPTDRAAKNCFLCFPVRY